MRKFASLMAAGAMLLSSTAAFAEGSLSAAGPADVHQARILGLAPATFVITTTIITTIIVVAVVESNSSNHT